MEKITRRKFVKMAGVAAAGTQYENGRGRCCGIIP